VSDELKPPHPIGRVDGSEGFDGIEATAADFWRWAFSDRRSRDTLNGVRSGGDARTEHLSQDLLGGLDHGSNELHLERNQALIAGRVSDVPNMSAKANEIEDPCEILERIVFVI